MHLIQGDCIEEMQKLNEFSVDLTVTSPPYDNLRTYNGNNDQWGEHVWKSVIKELYRVTKDGGVVVWVVGDATIKGSETGTSFRQALWAMKCGFNLHDTMIWRKTNAMPNVSKKRYTPCFEYMFVWSKGQPNSCNRISQPTKYAGKVIQTNTTNPESIMGYRNRKATKATKPLQNIWDIIVAGTNHGHPAIFPEKLAHDPIISWSNEGDTVLDPFMGSGTTGKIAKQLGRNFIGIELDKEYFEIAKKRINSVEDSLF